MSEQGDIFGPNFSSIFSGTIIDQWRKQEDNLSYAFVSYTAVGAVSTPKTLQIYEELQSQWAKVTLNLDLPSSTTPPSCPSSSSEAWSISEDAPLTAIAGLDFATMSKTHLSVTANSTSTSSSMSITSIGRPRLSSGEKAGIGVGVASGVILFLSLVYWIHLRRTKRKSQTVYGPVKELPADEVADELPDTTRGKLPDDTVKKELPGDHLSHELGSGPSYEADDGVREAGTG